MNLLSVSNIAWNEENDEIIYKKMHDIGFAGLEIAPTRIFPENPYDRIEEAKDWAKRLFDNYNLKIASMQSIWYGRNEKLFGSKEERKILVEYTKKAICFAEAVGCSNLVFGCPKNRYRHEFADESIAIEFFKEIGDYAYNHNTVIGMEANPLIYNTNYVNDTEAAFSLINQVDSMGFKLNLDVGTMVENDENLSVLEGRGELINHVHISEPGLKVIEKRELHKELAYFLKKNGYQKYVSIEVGRQDDIAVLLQMMEYVKTLFGDNE